MAEQKTFGKHNSQTSQQGLILALLAGAVALIVALGGLFSLSLINQAEPYLTGRVTTERDVSSNETPNIISQRDDENIRIVEVNDEGNVTRVIFNSDLSDGLADFELFAVPRENYQGFVYLQSVQDAESGNLIVYPLNVGTGKLSAALTWVNE